MRSVLLWLSGLTCAALALVALFGDGQMRVQLGWLAGQLALLFAALAFERFRYRPLDAARPGQGFAATDECFVDPETGAPVRVWFNAATGERRYVAC